MVERFGVSRMRYFFKSPSLRLLLEYSSEAGKLQELTDRVLHFHHKNPEHWLVQVGTLHM